MLWGIDLGGTKIEGVVIQSREEPEVLVRKRIDTERDQGYKHIISRIASLVESMGKEVGEKPASVGFGTPGTLDRATQKMKNCNSVVLNGRPFKRDIKKALGVPVEIANDANCFALAETVMGAIPQKYPDARRVFGVIMGTGVGGGIIHEGRILAGAQGIGGEWGHTFLDASGGPCYCGNAGCVETIISGPALERYYKKRSGNELSLKEIIQNYHEGPDLQAEHTIDRLLTFFAKGLANVINILDPEVVLLGGGVGNIDLLYTEGVERMKRHVFNTDFNTIVDRPVLGDSAGVFGAALLTS